MHDIADEELVRRAQKGDRAAFATLVNRYYDKILGFAYRGCGQRQDAEDMAQEVCVKLAQNLSSFRFESKFSTWFYRLGMNAIQDYHRGVIVGESTYGKGTVQQVVPLDKYIHDEGAGSLKITVQKFYRATGSSTQHKGVTPDVKLPSALDPEQFGESSNPNALPWDEIKSALYQRTPMVDDKILAGLNKAYRERLKSDPYLNKFVNETNETRRNIEQKRVSLSETVRKKEMEDAEQRKAANHKMDTKIDGEGRPVSTPLQLDDEYLREGLMVLADLIITKVG